MTDESGAPDLPILIAPERSGPESSAFPQIQPGVRIGESVGSLPGLVGTNGATHSIVGFERADVLVLGFLGDACPAVKACVESLVSLQRRLTPHAVQVIGVNSNNPYLSPTDTLPEMTRWAAVMDLNFPYLKDAEGVWARRLGVTNTPHFVVLDRERRLRYRGRMFDSRDPGRAESHDLEDAVNCLLAGRSIENPETHPLGCSIVW